MSLELINPLVQEYAERFSSPEDALLKEINDFTATNHPEYHMLSGHLQGKFLEMASMMIRPRRVLEMGTFTGYSALCLAKGLTEDGLLYTIELRERDAITAKGFFDRSAYKEKIILHTGDAKKIVSTLEETFDLVFIDADKKNNGTYYDLVFEKVRKGGLIVVDNVLWSGKVTLGATDKDTENIRHFNEKVSNDQRTEKFILPVRDGLFIIRKL